MTAILSCVIKQACINRPRYECCAMIKIKMENYRTLQFDISEEDKDMMCDEGYIQTNVQILKLLQLVFLKDQLHHKYQVF